MQQGIKKLQWFEYFKVVFLEILNAGLCRVFANQVTYMLSDQYAVYNESMKGNSVYHSQLDILFS